MDEENVLVCFHVDPSASIDETWAELESKGCQLLYSSETEEGAKEIYGYLSPDFDLESTLNVSRVTPATLDIDWFAQWEKHGLNFYDGLVHVDLNQFGIEDANPAVIVMEPGGGFGDLSHPTTRLMLKMMASNVKGKHVIDVGSGSGILSLAAASMGAAEVQGIDIDPEANRHAHRNAELNHIKEKINFVLPQNFKLSKGGAPLCILANMISSEQNDAWKMMPDVHKLPGDRIISGLLEEEREDYLEQAKKWGWTLQRALEEEGWLALHFVNNSE